MIENVQYVMTVEYQHPECDFGVLVDDTLEDIIIQYINAKNTKWHHDLGACPNIKILTLSDILNKKDFNKKEIRSLINANS